MERALQWSTGSAGQTQDPQRWNLALALMRNVEQAVKPELAAENGGKVRCMRWLVARTDSEAWESTAGLAGNAGQLILLVAGPGGRKAGRRSNEIVALQLDADGFPVKHALTLTAAINELLNLKVTNYKAKLWVKAPSLQQRGRASGSTGGWVRLQQWLQCMYRRPGRQGSTGKKAAAAAGPGRPYAARSSRSRAAVAETGSLVASSSRNRSSNSNGSSLCGSR
jgi:hypothetical protein